MCRKNAKLYELCSPLSHEPRLQNVDTDSYAYVRFFRRVDTRVSAFLVKDKLENKVNTLAGQDFTRADEQVMCSKKKQLEPDFVFPADDVLGLQLPLTHNVVYRVLMRVTGNHSVHTMFKLKDKTERAMRTGPWKVRLLSAEAVHLLPWEKSYSNLLCRACANAPERLLKLPTQRKWQNASPALRDYVRTGGFYSPGDRVPANVLLSVLWPDTSLYKFAMWVLNANSSVLAGGLPTKQFAERLAFGPFPFLKALSVPDGLERENTWVLGLLREIKAFEFPTGKLVKGNREASIFDFSYHADINELQVVFTPDTPPASRVLLSDLQRGLAEGPDGTLYFALPSGLHSVKRGVGLASMCPVELPVPLLEVLCLSSGYNISVETAAKLPFLRFNHAFFDGEKTWTLDTVRCAFSFADRCLFLCNNKEPNENLATLIKKARGRT